MLITVLYMNSLRKLGTFDIYNVISLFHMNLVIQYVKGDMGKIVKNAPIY